MHGTQLLKALVTEPLQKYAKLLGKDGLLDSHNISLYHKNVAKLVNDFQITYLNPSKEIINIIHSKREEQILENRARLRPIIESLIFLGRQNIPLRGHRDDGKEIFQEQEASVINNGNFKELLKFKIDSGDRTLENHLKTSNAGATYISKRVQNELIECCRQEIVNSIMLEVKEAKFYSIIFDETTDVSNASQITLKIRYILNNQVNEKFIGFIDCHKYIFDKKKEQQYDDEDEIVNNDQKFEPKITGELLGDTVVNILKDYEFDLDKCIGIGTDGCSVMVSTARGAVQQIQKYAKYAIHCPCTNHALNLSISKSSTVQLIRNCIGVMKEVISFFHISAKRNYVLKKHLQHRTTLIGLCETRWNERHDSVLQFKTSIREIVDALIDISNWEDSISSTKSNILVSAICNCDFIFSLVALSSALSITSPISKLLQGRSEDVSTASKYINDIIYTLEKHRKGCEESFKDIFKECEIILNDLNIEIKLPRLVGRQKHRSCPTNPQSPEVYYRINLYIPLLDCILQDMSSRFTKKENKNLFTLMQLIPSNLVKENNDTVLRTILQGILEITMKNPIFSDVTKEAINSELDIWCTKWQT